MATNTLDPELLQALKDWKRTFYGYGVTHYVLFILGIAAGAIVTASSGSAVAGADKSFLDPIWTTVLGIIATVAVGVTNGLDTGGKQKRFNKAWSHLNEAVMRHRANPTNFPAEKVIDAWGTGENIINEVPREGKKPP